MSNTDCLAALGVFTFLMVWSLFVAENGQKLADVNRQENYAISRQQ